MIVLIDSARYRLVTPESEAWLEKAVQSNCEHIFGRDSFYFDIKKLIRSKAGVASIPDGYVILFTPKPRWAIVEVELASHPIYDHLIPQLAKFNKGIEDSATRRQLVDILYKLFEEDEVLKARLKQKLQTGEIYKFISDLVSEQPLIVVVIDKKTKQLEEGVETIKGYVEVIEFRTFRREGVSEDVNAFVFEPMFSEPEEGTKAISIQVSPFRPPKRRGIMQSVFGLFDDKGVDNVTYRECESIAREVKPDTKFNKYYFSNYKKRYKRKPEGRGTDRFGSPVGSNQAKINAVLSTEPKMMKTLVQEAGLSGGYYGHLKSLIEKGFVEKTDKGFRIVGRKKVITDHPTRGIMHSVFELFDKKGVDNVTYDECESIAREVKPDTKFNKRHFSWYKKKYKQKGKRGLPRGLKLRSVYKGIEFTAELVEDGKIRFRDQTYNSPSAAAIAAIQSTGSKRKNEDGLRWWKFVDPKTGEEKSLDDVNAYLFEPLRSRPDKQLPRDGYSEFWEPIRREGLFKGKPVPTRNEAWIAKWVRGIPVELVLQDHKCLVQVSCQGEDRSERRRNIIGLFPKNEYEYKVHESPKSARVRFPVLDKGKKDREHWPEMREKLTKLGTDIYNKIKESGI